MQQTGYWSRAYIGLPNLLGKTYIGCTPKSSGFESDETRLEDTHPEFNLLRCMLYFG